MGTVNPVFVPTVADAGRVAEAVAVSGAGRVLLFGSVARDEAHPHSDIDLMVIYDDLDYNERWDVRSRLTRLAGSAVEWPVDIHVTDRPEWKMRTEQVRTSFESRVKRQGMLLVDNQPAKVDWDKEMVKPRSGYEEAVERLSHMHRALGTVENSFTPSFAQRRLENEGEAMMAFAEYEQRLIAGCAAGQLAVETAVKSLIHLSSTPTSRAWVHNIVKLMSDLTASHKAQIEWRIASVGVKQLSNWQQEARYERVTTVTPEQFRAIIGAACSVAGYTADQFHPGLPIIGHIRRRVEVIEDSLEHRDLHTGIHPLERARDHRGQAGSSRDF